MYGKIMIIEHIEIHTRDVTEHRQPLSRVVLGAVALILHEVDISGYDNLGALLCVNA